MRVNLGIMDRSAHVWGKYKALLTVISSYNSWVVFHYISFSWLTAFLKSLLNGKLIGWLNLHFNQTIYDRSSPRNSLAEGRGRSLRDLTREAASECVHSPILSPVFCPKVSVCEKNKNSSGFLQPATSQLICRRKVQMHEAPGEGSSGHI